MARIKGLVMENINGRAVILTPEGEYKRVRINKVVGAGELFNARSFNAWKYGLVATIILAITLGTMDYFSVQAYAQVSSLELGINRWDRVITARALDPAGEEILNQADIKGQKVDEAVELIIDTTRNKAGHVEETPPENVPLSATIPDDKNEDFKQRVEQNMNKGLQRALDKNNTKDHDDIRESDDREKADKEKNSRSNAHNNTHKNENNGSNKK